MDDHELFQQVQHRALSEIGAIPSAPDRQCAARAHVAAGIAALIAESGSAITAEFLSSVAQAIRQTEQHTSLQ